MYPEMGTSSHEIYAHKLNSAEEAENLYYLILQCFLDPAKDQRFWK